MYLGVEITENLSWSNQVKKTCNKANRALNFTTHLNSINPAIQFTRELEQNGTIAMLDTLIHRLPNGHLKFTIYRKTTHTDHYLQFDSHQPLEHKLSVIRTLTHRSKNNITNLEDQIEENEHIKKIYT